MATNPFQYQRPLRPEAVIDRVREVERLIARCDAGTMFRLDAPRRYGKTSLIGKTFAEASKNGTVGVLVDFKGILTLNDMIVRIGRAYGALQGPLRGWLTKTLKGFELDFDIKILGTGGGLKLARRSDSEEALLFQLLDMPNKIAERGVQQLIVCFDEFQDVLAVEAADDKMRSAIQHHDDFVSYVFAGSEPRLMQKLFAEKKRAFWDQAEPLTLKPLLLSDCFDYVVEKFEETGKDAGDNATRLVSAAQGHPQRTMLLANKLWEETTPGAAPDIDVWERAFEAAMLQEQPLLEAEWRSLSEIEQRSLRAIVLFDGRPGRNEAMESVGIAAGSVDKAVKGLKDKYVVRELEKSTFSVIDPLLAVYVNELAGSRQLGSSAD